MKLLRFFPYHECQWFWLADTKHRYFTKVTVLLKNPWLWKYMTKWVDLRGVPNVDVSGKCSFWVFVRQSFKVFYVYIAFACCHFSSTLSVYVNWRAITLFMTNVKCNSRSQWNHESSFIIYTRCEKWNKIGVCILHYTADYEGGRVKALLKARLCKHSI